MKIVLPYAKIHQAPENPLPIIEAAGRISHRSEEAQTSESWDRFIRTVVIQHGDWSIVEHVSVSVDMLVDRGITHELVRHRLFSFTQESTRFVNYEKKMPPSFIYPKPDVKCEHCLSGNEVRYNGSWSHSLEPKHVGKVTYYSDGCAYDQFWLEAIAKCEISYKLLLQQGWRPQEARSVFPNALASRILVTGNLRNWRHIFIMRTTLEAHPQMRQVMIPLLAEFKKYCPILFDDIEPNARQIENLRKPR